MLKNIDFIFFKNQTRFGIGFDVYFDATSYEIDLGLGTHTLTIVINK